jgi:hypothetical protein
VINDHGGLRAISCPNESFCAVIDSGGQVVFGSR